MDPTITPDRRDGAVNRTELSLSEMSFGIRSNSRRLSADRAAAPGTIFVNQSDRYTERNYRSSPKSPFHNYVSTSLGEFRAGFCGANDVSSFTSDRRRFGKGESN